MRRQASAESLRIESGAESRRVEAEWTPGDSDAEETNDALGRFLVERYALYNEVGPLLRLLLCLPSQKLWRGDITHEPWPLHSFGQVAILQSYPIHPSSHWQLSPTHLPLQR